MKRKLWMMTFVACVLALSTSAWATALRPLDTSAAAWYGATHVVEITDEDLTETSTNTAQTITNLFTVASNSTVELVAMELVEAFSDDATNAFNSVAVTVGDGDDTDLFLQSTEVSLYGTMVWIKPGRVWQGTNTVVAAVTGVTSTAGAFMFNMTTTTVAFCTNLTLITTTLTNMAEHTAGIADVVVVTNITVLQSDAVTGLTQTKSNALKTVTAATADVAQSGAAYGPKTYTAHDTVDFIFTPVATYALSALDNGKVRFYFRVYNRPRD